MITASEVLETKRMVEQDNLDVRTITMGISLLDCASSDLNETCDKIYKKTTSVVANAWGMDRMSSSSLGVMPLLTMAENPPRKLTPIVLAASSRVLAIFT